MKVLLTGGTGYIGSHLAVELLMQGTEVVLIDNLSNSKASVLSQIEKITGQMAIFYAADLLDRDAILSIFKKERVDAVIHLAGLKAVGESITDPLRYYEVNLTGTINLCQAVMATQVKQFVFSSSAAVYGGDAVATEVSVTEESPVTHAANPYARSKIYIERILQDLTAATPGFNVALLRYFNPAGAHLSGAIGEDACNHPGTLISCLTQVAIGKQKDLVIFGDDYPTPDGSCVRDYIHILDLALGHIAALKKLNSNPGLVIYNLGTGKGHSVREVVTVFEQTISKHIPTRIGPRRDGDMPTCVADPSLALSELNWQAEKGLSDICRDAWRWRQLAPRDSK